MQSKVNSLQRAGDLNNALLTEIRDTHEHCIPNCIISNVTLMVDGLNYLNNHVITYAYSRYLHTNFVLCLLAR